MARLNYFFVDILRTLDNTINELLRSVVSDFQFSSLVIFLGIAFFYGIMHSLGPGHGKTLVATFFLKEKNPLKKSLLLASIVSLVHTGSAVILSFLFYFVLTSIRGLLRIKIQSYFILASGILVLFLGILFLIFKIINHNKKTKDKKLLKEESDNKSLFMIGIASGIIPCPVSLMLMLFAISENFILIGLLAVASISLGMFFVLSIIGFISIKSRDGLLLVSQKAMKRTELISQIVEYISIIIIILIGSFMVFNMIYN